MLADKNSMAAPMRPCDQDVQEMTKEQLQETRDYPVYLLSGVPPSWGIPRLRQVLAYTGWWKDSGGLRLSPPHPRNRGPPLYEIRAPIPPSEDWAPDNRGTCFSEGDKIITFHANLRPERVRSSALPRLPQKLAPKAKLPPKQWLLPGWVPPSVAQPSWAAKVPDKSATKTSAPAAPPPGGLPKHPGAGYPPPPRAPAVPPPFGAPTPGTPAIPRGGPANSPLDQQVLIAQFMQRQQDAMPFQLQQFCANLAPET